MLKAKYDIVNQWDKSEVLKNQTLEFESISDLEDFIAYNRAYILNLSFTGQFNKEAN